MKGDIFSRMTERTLGTAPAVRPVIPSRFAYGPVEHIDNTAGFDDLRHEEQFNPLGNTEAGKFKDRSESKVLPPVDQNQTSHSYPPAPQEHHRLVNVKALQIVAAKPSGKKKGELAGPARQDRDVKAPQKHSVDENPQLLIPKKKNEHEMTVSSLGLEKITPARIQYRQTEEKKELPDATSHRTSQLYPKDQPYQFQHLKKQQEKSGSTAPTIRVTIGRIDVRAVTTPQPLRQPVRKQPAPSLTLDDYLKQRNEGRR